MGGRNIMTKLGGGELNDRLVACGRHSNKRAPKGTAEMADFVAPVVG